MPSIRTTLYLPDDVLTCLYLPDKQAEGERTYTLSGRMRSAVLRYHQILDSLMPRFTKAEWCAIFNANNATVFDGPEGMGTATMVWANVSDARELGSKWDIDPSSLVDKLRALTPAQGIAVVEAIDRFWSNYQMETDALLKHIRVPIEPDSPTPTNQPSNGKPKRKK